MNRDQMRAQLARRLISYLNARPWGELCSMVGIDAGEASEHEQRRVSIVVEDMKQRLHKMASAAGGQLCGHAELTGNGTADSPWRLQ